MRLPEALLSLRHREFRAFFVGGLAVLAAHAAARRRARVVAAE